MKLEKHKKEEPLTMLAIRIDSEVKAELAKRAAGFETANKVLRRILGLPEKDGRKR